MQIITITGRLGDDSKEGNAGGTAVLNFSVASDQGYGERKTTNWFRCALWGTRGKALSHHLLKGKEVTVSGELEVGSYEGKTQLNIRVADVSLHGGKSGGGGETYEPEKQAELEDDIPFASPFPVFEHRVS